MAKTTDLQHSDPALRAVAEVRNLVGAPHFVFEDDSFTHYLTTAGGNTVRAAALALVAIANSEAHIQKVIKTLKLETDGAKLADSYRASAALFLKMPEAAPPESIRPAAPRAKTSRPRRVDGFTRRGHHAEHCRHGY